MNENESIGKVINYTKKIEGILENKYAAEGKGLHEKVSSVESRLDEAIVKRIRYIASVRNGLMHEPDYTLDDPINYYKTCEGVIKHLDEADVFEKEYVSEKNEKVFPKLSSNRWISYIEKEFPPLHYNPWISVILYIIIGAFVGAIMGLFTTMAFGSRVDERSEVMLVHSFLGAIFVGGKMSLILSEKYEVDDYKHIVWGILIIGFIVGFIGGISEGGIGRAIVFGLLGVLATVLIYVGFWVVWGLTIILFFIELLIIIVSGIIAFW